MTAKHVIHGLVLAGGKSRRMGVDKALLQRDGQSQLSFAVALLGKHLPRVYVSARRDQQQEPERNRFELIVDRYDDMGPVAGILAAFASNPKVSWLILACDLPNVDDATIATLIAAHSVEYPFTAYKSTHDGLPEPLCAIFSPSGHAVVEAFVADGLVCPRKMLIRSDTQLLEAVSPAALDNMNTPEDLERARIGIAS